MEPIVDRSPPETPFTSHVTVVVVEVVELARFTTAVKVVWVFNGTVIDVGVMAMEVTVLVVPLPPPHPADAQSTSNTDRADSNGKLALEQRDVRGKRMLSSELVPIVEGFTALRALTLIA
jgi:hypothetical protein